MLALTPQEQARVEENMGLVGMVLRDYVHTPPPGSVYTEEDLYQIGCIGLCKVVQTDKAGHSAAFSTYASRLIRNEIYDALEYSTRHSREQATDPDDLPHVRLDDELEQHMLYGALFDQLDRAEAMATGTVAKGIQAIRLLAQGYTNREIGEQFHAPANHVTAQVVKARKHLAAITAQKYDTGRNYCGKQNLTVPFPRNLLCDVFGEETVLKELPPGIDEGLEYMLENMMPERDAFILILRYMRNMKIREIAAYYGLSSGRIHQIIQKAHRRLRYPRCRKCLLDDCVRPEWETPQVAEKQISLTPPADPRPEEAICNIENAHIRIDAIMARGGLNRIEWLDLPIRAYNCLMNSQVETVQQLCLLSPTALLQIKNLGVGTLAAIQEKLCVHNLVLDNGTMEIDDQMWDYAEERYAALAAHSG